MAKDLSLVVRMIDMATGPLKKFNEGLGGLAAPVRNVNSSLRSLSDASGVSRLGSAFMGVGTQVVSLGKTIVGVLAGSGVAGVALSSLVMSSMKAGDDLGKASARVGMSVDGYYSLGYALKKGGMSSEEFAKSMEHLNKARGDLTLDKGSLKEVLETASPALLAQVRKVKDNETAIKLLTAALQKIQDPARRATLTTAFLGEAGAKAVPALQEGVGALHDMRTEGMRLAGSQTQLAMNAAQLDDAMTDSKVAFEGLKGAALKELMPALTTLSKELTELFVANRPQIEAWAKDFGEKLPGRVTTFIAKVRELGADISRIVARLGGWKNAALLLVAVLAGPLLLSMVQLGWAIGVVAIKLGVLAFAPVVAGVKALVTGLLALNFSLGTTIAITGLMVGVFAAVALAIGGAAYLVYTYWEPIKGFFAGVWEAIKKAFAPVYEFFVGLWEGIKGIFAPTVANFKSLWNDVKDIFWTFVNWGKETFAPLFGGIADNIASKWAPLKDALKLTWEGIVGVFQWAWGVIRPIVDPIIRAADFIAARFGAIRAVGKSKIAMGGIEQQLAVLNSTQVFDEAMRGGAPVSRQPMFGAAAARPPLPGEGAKAKIKVEFSNAPKGTNMSIEETDDAEVDMSRGYSMAQ